MPYDKDLDKQIESIVLKDKMNKKKMFGGTCYFFNDKMVSGVYKDFMIVKVGEIKAQEAIQNKMALPFDITGKPMKNWIMINKDSLNNKEIAKWIDIAKQNLSDK